MKTSYPDSLPDLPGQGFVGAGPDPLDLSLADSAEAVIRDSRAGSILRVMSPVIDDPEIIDLILEARRRGVVVKCVTSLTDARKGVVTKGWDEAQNLPAHHEAIRMLAKAGVLLRSPATTPHAKMLHLENECAWFGSANLTSNSLRGNAVEAAVRIRDSDILGGLRNAFDDVWSFSSLSMMSHSGSVSLRESRPNSTLSRQPRRQEWAIGGDASLLVSHPGGAPLLPKMISDQIAQASGEVILVAMSLYQTDMIPLLGEALEHGLERGLEVRAVVRPEQFKTEDYPDLATSRLIHSGMKLLGVTGLHAKGFLIDGKWCGLQSANFNPYSLSPECDTANVEFGLVGPADHPMFSEWTTMIRYLADHPSHQFLPSV